MRIDIDLEKRALQQIAEQAAREDERVVVDLTPGWSLGISYVGPEGEREWFGYRGPSWGDLQRCAGIQVLFRREQIEAEKKAAGDLGGGP